MERNLMDRSSTRVGFFKTGGRELRQRHLFAAGLLESGVDLLWTQELPGHASSKTTEIYTHVNNKSLGKIINPLDQAGRRLKTK